MGGWVPYLLAVYLEFINKIFVPKEKLYKKIYLEKLNGEQKNTHQ